MLNDKIKDRAGQEGGCGWRFGSEVLEAAKEPSVDVQTEAGESHGS